jgi:long-chain acyl-CoA synthetase
MSELQASEQVSMSEVMERFRGSLTAPGARYEVGEEDVRGTRMPVFARRARSLRELLDATTQFGDRTYVVDRETRLDFRTHRRLVGALAADLQRTYGLRPGDRVAIFAANCWEWVVTFWAVTSAGGIPCAFNGWWTPDEFAHAARLVEPVLVIGDGPRLARVGESDVAVPVLDMDTDLTAVLDSRGGDEPSLTASTEDDPAVLIFTSGTTGRPKAVTVPIERCAALRRSPPLARPWPRWHSASRCRSRATSRHQATTWCS